MDAYVSLGIFVAGVVVGGMAGVGVHHVVARHEAPAELEHVLVQRPLKRSLSRIASGPSPRRGGVSAATSSPERRERPPQPSAEQARLRAEALRDAADFGLITMAGHGPGTYGFPVRAEEPPETATPPPSLGTRIQSYLGAPADLFGVDDEPPRSSGELGVGQGFGAIGPPHGTGSAFHGTPANRSPTIHPGPITVTGSLPPEVVTRIVRSNFGRFRVCYQSGSRTKPKLSGWIEVSFTISESGLVEDISSTATLPDESVKECVARAFNQLTFPQPESGKVKVHYPIEFLPGSRAS